MRLTGLRSPAQTTDPQTARARSAYRVAVILLVAAAVAAVLQLYLAFLSGAWQLFVSAGALLALAGALVVSARLSRRDQATPATQWLIGGMLIAVVVVSTVLAGLGLVLGLATLLATVATATQTLPQNKVNQSVALGTAASVAAGLLDLSAPPWQLAVPALQAVTPAVVVVTLLVYAVLVARRYRSYALPSKLIVAFLTVSVVSIGAVSVFTDRTIRSSLTEQAGADLRDFAGLQALAIGDVLDQQVDSLQSFSLSKIIQDRVEATSAGYTGDPATIEAELQALDRQWRAAGAANNDADPLVQARLNNEIASELREYRSLFPENVEVFVTDRYGALLGATNRTSDYYQADEDWWRAAFNRGRGAPYIGQPEYDESSATFSSIVAVPLYAHGTRDVVGILRTTFNLEVIAELLSRAQAGQASHLELLLPNGAFLQRTGTTLAASDFLSALRATTSDYLEIDFQGAPSLISQAPVAALDPREASLVAGLGWTLVVHQDRAEVLALVDRQVRSTLLVAVIVAGAMAGAAVVLGQWLATPLARLTAAASQVSAGDLGAQAEIESADEVGMLASVFNDMTAQLRSLIGSLGAQVEARTAQLRASADVGRAAASILDTDQLLREAVNLIADRFGFYYVAVFTLDESGRFAVLREATGEAGRLLKERGHKLDVGGRSMVGAATGLRRPRIALDVGQEAVRFANPLLPETRSEIALPLIVGDRVLGALDAQSTQAAAFDEASAATLQAMADQIAIALNNAALFRRAEAQATAQTHLNAISRSLFGAADVEALYRALAAQVRRLAPHDALSVSLHESEGMRLREYDLRAGADPVVSQSRMRPVANTLAGRAFTARALAVSANTADDARALDDVADLARAGFQSAASVPLALGDRVLGTINFASREPQAYSPDRLALVEQVAAQFAAALENLRLAEAQQRSLHELSELTRQLTGLGWAEELKRAPGGVYEAHISRSGLQPVQQSWLPEAELAVAAVKPVAWSRREDQTLTSPFQAAMAAPIVVRGEAIGMLQVGEESQPRAWSQDDLALIQAVADQVAQAVENARLLEQTRRAAQRERALGESTDRIRRSPEMERILQTAAEELARHLKTSHVAVRLSPIPETGNGQTQAESS
jgi:GAF domain-containing protein/HAMP domain-containing protein